jgi:lipid II:glycine glycyltransferase (peptidoglycan interpeptide bridge formation enzyme)
MNSLATSTIGDETVAEAVQYSKLAIQEAGSTFSKRWNAALAQAEFPHIQQSFEHAVWRSHTGWRSELVAVEKAGRLVAGAVILNRPIPIIGWSFATIHCGPWWLPCHREILPGLFQFITEHCRRSRTLCCRYNIPCATEAFEELQQYIPSSHRISRAIWSYWNPPRPVAIMDLRGTFADVVGRMHKNIRYGFRLSQKNGVTVRAGGLKDLPAVVRLLQARLHRKDVPVRNYSYYEKLLRAYPSDRLKLVLAEVKGELAAFHLAAYLGRTASLIYAAMDEDKRQASPVSAVEMGSIEWASRMGCESYDLGGTCTGWPPHPEHKGFGVWEHKKHLGATAVLTAPYCDIPIRRGSAWIDDLAEDLFFPLLREKGRSKLLTPYRRLIARYRESANG